MGNRKTFLTSSEIQGLKKLRAELVDDAILTKVLKFIGKKEIKCNNKEVLMQFRLRLIDYFIKNYINDPNRGLMRRLFTAHTNDRTAQGDLLIECIEHFPAEFREMHEVILSLDLSEKKEAAVSYLSNAIGFRGSKEIYFDYDQFILDPGFDLSQYGFKGLDSQTVTVVNNVNDLFEGIYRAVVGKEKLTEATSYEQFVKLAAEKISPIPNYNFKTNIFYHFKNWLNIRTDTMSTSKEADYREVVHQVIFYDLP